MQLFRFLVFLGFVCTAVVEAQDVFDVFLGPRQFAMGGAGVALIDRGRSQNFNPALPALSFPEDRIGLALHPTLRESFQGAIRFKEGGFPQVNLYKSDEPFAASFLGLPAIYFPKLGYFGIDKHSVGTEWGRDIEYRESGYSLTLSLANDFMEKKPIANDSTFKWTGGISLKRFNTSYNVLYPDTVVIAQFKNFVYDIGWAWSFSHISYIPGLQANIGFALLNLGATYSNDKDTYSQWKNSLNHEYRIGWSLEERPFKKIILVNRKWTPIKILATQEFKKYFYSYDEFGNPRPFYTAFFKDFDKDPSDYWDETEINMGAEITLMSLVSFRYGRGHSSFNWLHPTWSFGYGISSGPIFKNFFFNYDYARVLNLGAGRDVGSASSPREYGFQMGYLF